MINKQTLAKVMKLEKSVLWLKNRLANHTHYDYKTKQRLRDLKIRIEQLEANQRIAGQKPLTVTDIRK